MRVFSVPVSVPLLRTVIAALVDGRLVDGFEARNDPGHWQRQRCIFRPGAPGGWRARFFSMSCGPMRRSCRASWRSATSMRMSWRLRKIPNSRRHRAAGYSTQTRRTRTPAGAGETGRRLGQAAGAVAAGGRRRGLDADTGRRSCAADGRHGDARRRLGRARRLVPDQFDKYWQHTLEFLQIAREFWPGFLPKPTGSNPRRAATC